MGSLVNKENSIIKDLCIIAGVCVTSYLLSRFINYIKWDDGKCKYCKGRPYMFLHNVTLKTKTYMCPKCGSFKEIPNE